MIVYLLYSIFLKDKVMEMCTERLPVYMVNTYVTYNIVNKFG